MGEYVIQCNGRRKLVLVKGDDGYKVITRLGDKDISTLELTPAAFCELRDATLNLLR